MHAKKCAIFCARFMLRECTCYQNEISPKLKCFPPNRYTTIKTNEFDFSALPSGCVRLSNCLANKFFCNFVAVQDHADGVYWIDHPNIIAKKSY